MLRSLTFRLLLTIFLAAMAIPAPRPTVAQACSDDAEVVDQIVEPAAEMRAAGSDFSVAWTVRNSGDCTWSRSYRLIFVGGERMEGARTTRLRSAVEPGESVTFTLELVAPEDEDRYSGRWRLRNAGGEAFGPELVVEVAVGEVDAGEAAATVDVVLPEVLAFGGMGAGGDSEAISICLENDEFPDVPKLVVDQDSLDFRYAILYLCGLSEGTEVTVETIDPEGNLFTRSYIEDAPVSGFDSEGNEYVGTVLFVNLTWLKQAPSGEWLVTITSEELSEEIVIDVPLPLEVSDPYPILDNWPTAPIDPFTDGCHYAYLPYQEMMVSGDFLPPNTALPLGLYQARLGNAYLIEQMTVQTDEAGAFEMPFAARAEPGQYNLIILLEIDEEAIMDDETYSPSYGGEMAFACFTVKAEEETERPLRIAFTTGELGLTEVTLYELVADRGYYPTFNSGSCDASEPAWWPDGEWIIYQSNCVRGEGEYGVEFSAADDYDLYASMIDFSYAIPDEEKLVRFTETPDLHETEPDANPDGLVVYVGTPVGESLEEVGELRVLDIFNQTDTSLGLFGRAPTWSPDGTRIAFASNIAGDIEASWNIYIYDMEDDELWLASRDCPSDCLFPAWSPNGRQIIYQVTATEDNSTPAGLWIASVVGISKPRLFLAGDYTRPSWSSEGWIAFQGPQGIYRATAGDAPTIERYLANNEWSSYWMPVWSH